MRRTDVAGAARRRRPRAGPPAHGVTPGLWLRHCPRMSRSEQPHPIRDQRHGHQDGGSQVDDLGAVGEPHEQHARQEARALPAGKGPGLEQGDGQDGEAQRQEGDAPQQHHPALVREHGQQTRHHRAELVRGHGIQSRHGEAQRALVRRQDDRTEDAHRSADQTGPGPGGAIQQPHEVHGDHDQESRVQRDQHVAKLQQAGIVSSEDESFRAQQIRVQKTRVDGESEDEHQREDDEAQSCANTLDSTQRRIPIHDNHSFNGLNRPGFYAVEDLRSGFYAVE